MEHSHWNWQLGGGELERFKYAFRELKERRIDAKAYLV